MLSRSFAGYIKVIRPEMQHIGLRRQTESGGVLAEFEGGLDPKVIERVPPSSSCLRFIDPYGDTIFNQLQIPVLVSELVELQTTVSEQELKSHIELVLLFLRASEEVHVYVCFVGD